MLHTENKIVIDAPRDIIFDLAADIERWPQLLSHYRFVRVLEPNDGNGSRLVKMAVRRSGIPVSWTSTQRLDREIGEVIYIHVAGATRGMHVVWRIEPAGKGCAVSIVHDLRSARWWMRPAPVQYIVARFFVQSIADRTLRGIKAAAELRRGQLPLCPPVPS